MYDGPFLRAKKVRFGNSPFFCMFSHICSFQKSNCAITLFCCSMKKCEYAIALFCCSLKKWDCVMALFLLFENMQLCYQTFFHSLKMCDCGIVHFCTFQQWKKMCNCTFALSKRANVQKIAHFQNMRIHNPGTMGHVQRAQKVWLHNHTFLKSNKKCNHTIAH